MNDFKQQLAPTWSPVNIGIVVLLLVLSVWPFALAMVAYVIWGKGLGLNLGQPHTLGVFAKRISTAWRAAVAAFKGSSTLP